MRNPRDSTYSDWPTLGHEDFGLEVLGKDRAIRLCAQERPLPKLVVRTEAMRGDGIALHGLIFDLGASEGNDSAFYLAKGFKVIAVEADPWMVTHLRERFASEIASGTFKLLPFAASDSFGDLIDFHVHKEFQGVSGMSINPDLDANDYFEPRQVLTIDWKTLLTQGTPKYVKIDIETNEVPFLMGMSRTDIVPEFISVEVHNLDPVECLFELGYRRFMLVDQVPISGFKMPTPQKEGNHVAHPDFRHASGPFGLDVFYDNAWTDIDGLRAAWIEARPSGARGTWFDCHAWKPVDEQPRRLIRRLLGR